MSQIVDRRLRPEVVKIDNGGGRIRTGDLRRAAPGRSENGPDATSFFAIATKNQNGTLSGSSAAIAGAASGGGAVFAVAGFAAAAGFGFPETPRRF